MFKYLSILRKKATWKCGNLFIIRLAYTGYSCIGWLSLLPYKMILLEPENAITAFSGRTKLKKKLLAHKSRSGPKIWTGHTA